MEVDSNVMQASCSNLTQQFPPANIMASRLQSFLWHTRHCIFVRHSQRPPNSNVTVVRPTFRSLEQADILWGYCMTQAGRSDETQRAREGDRSMSEPDLNSTIGQRQNKASGRDRAPLETYASCRGTGRPARSGGTSRRPSKVVKAA